jgi:4-hydroxythreonine-4-phosphate dehydrogenase
LTICHLLLSFEKEKIYIYIMDQEISKPVIGITLGDFNGVGPEVIMKTFANASMLKICTPVIYGSGKLFQKYKKVLGIEDIHFQYTKSAEVIHHKKINLVNCWEEDHHLELGKVTDTAGSCARIALLQAAAELKKGFIEAVVTAPINKKNIQGADFNFPGHTEFFTSYFETKESLMLLTSADLRVAVVTGHIPLSQVATKLTTEVIVAKAKILLKSLQKDFGIQKPKIAILGLNPHAGDEGMFGDEEEKIILPAINQLKNEGYLVFGPYSSDGFFGMQQYKKFDAVLAMYHDQGLIPFKTLAFETGVNFTAGLPVIRTSPDHGTAYDIAGKNKADETSFREAVYQALSIIKSRKQLLTVREL